MRSPILLICFTLGHGLSFAQHASGPDSNAALQRLLDGNKRYVANLCTHPRQDPSRRSEVAKGQHPFAAVLTCADSRVPPEVVFDEGLGDLFTVRVAGNIATDDIVASLEYAVAHLGPKLIVVLGHQRCGAVEAAMKGGPPEGHLPVLLSRIQPAVDAVKGRSGDPLDLAIRQNVLNIVKQLRETQPILAKEVSSGDVKVLGARYDLESGIVDWLK